MRLCAIGNSHIAAFKKGWDRIERDHPDVSIQFFAAPGGSVSGLYVDNGQLVPRGRKLAATFRMTAGESVIQPDRFDAFFLCGLGLSLGPVISALIQEHLEFGADIQNANWRASFENSVAEMFKETRSYQTALLLRQVTSKPIVIVPHPLPIVPDGDSAHLHRPAVEAAFVAIGGVDQFLQLVKNAAEALPATVATVMWQPPETIVRGIYSKAEFLGEIDRYHMNGAFGAVAILPVLEHLAKALVSDANAPFPADVMAPTSRLAPVQASSMSSPYAELPRRSFWKTGVALQSPETVTGLWKPKFRIDRDSRVATAGSCFAQHIARHLRARGFGVLDVEPPPSELSDAGAKSFGYSIYSARYGNIYTARHFVQLLRETFEGHVPADLVWEKNGRFYDAMRPSVEPNGLASAELVLQHRNQHLKHVRELFTTANIVVFTMGLTEGWIHRDSGTVYPTAPGTIAGSFDPGQYAFKNFDFAEIFEDFAEARQIIMRQNASVKFLVTVSPVPLTATASDQHVLVATTYSKSVLRAVAGKLAMEFDNVDYFPSYEMIASPFSGAKFYQPGLREVADAGVQAVMRVFFDDKVADEQKGMPADPPEPTSDGASTPARPRYESRVVMREKLRAEREQKRAERLKRHAERAEAGAQAVMRGYFARA